MSFITALRKQIWVKFVTVTQLLELKTGAVLKFGDGTTMETAPAGGDATDLISEDANNALELGTDDKLYGDVAHLYMVTLSQSGTDAPFVTEIYRSKRFGVESAWITGGFRDGVGQYHLNVNGSILNVAIGDYLGILIAQPSDPGNDARAFWDGGSGQITINAYASDVAADDVINKLLLVLSYKKI